MRFHGKGDEVKNKRLVSAVAAASLVLSVGDTAWATDNQYLIADSFLNSTPGLTVITYDPNSNKYYDVDGNEIQYTEISGENFISVEVDRQIDVARMDMWSGQGYGPADGFILNFKENLTVNRNTDKINPYGSIWLDKGNYDLILNFASGKKLIIDGMTGSQAHISGGIVNEYRHTGDINVNGGALEIYLKRNGDVTGSLAGIFNNTDTGRIVVDNESILIRQIDSYMFNEYCNSYAIGSDNSLGVDINTGKLIIDKQAGAESQNIQKAFRSRGSQDVGIRVKADYLSVSDVDYGAYVFSGGSIVINSDEAYWTTDKQFNEWSVYATGENSRFVLNETSDKQLIASGYMKATNGGSITIRAGRESVLNHRSVIENDGVFNLTLADKAVWHMPHNNQVTSLEFSNGGVVDFNHDYNWSGEAPEFKTLTAGAIKGEGGTINLRMDMTKDAAEPESASSDRIVAENVEGTHVGVIEFINSGEVAEDVLHSNGWLISQQNGTMTITAPDGGNHFARNGGLTMWGLKFLSDAQAPADLDEVDWDALDNVGVGSGKWYLAQVESGETPPEVDQGLNLGSTVAQAIGWLSEKNDLRRRLGEVRYGSQAGAWVKAFARKDRADGFRGHGFKQESEGVHVGYDVLVGESEESSWLVGGTLRYAHADQEGLATVGGGDGDLESYSGKIYATWMHESGSYADVLAQVGYYDQEVSGIANDGASRYTGDYNSLGYGASVEIGHMFTLWNGADDRRWSSHVFFEPQLELSYFRIEGQKFKFSTGLGVNQDDADFLTGRLGFVLGKKWNFAGPDSLDRRYFQLGLIGGVTKEFKGEQSILFTDVDGRQYRVDGEGLGGHSYYYGLTMDWQVSDRMRIYGELDREEGDHYTKDYGVNIGLKYSF